MNLSFQIDPWAAVTADFQRLWPLQWEEMALDHNEIRYDPDWERYAELDRLGYLKIATARDEGRLVGWHVSTVSSHPHYRSSLFAMQDLYYVLPEYRRMPTVGLRLFQAMEDEMRRLGVKEMVGNTKLHLDRSAFFETAICYRKVLA